MSVYLDASVLVPLVVRQDASPSVIRFVEALDEAPTVSTFAIAEVGSAISRLVRMNEITSQRAGLQLDSFDRWTVANAQAVTVEPEDVEFASRLVRRFELKLRAPDALHLAICLRLRSTLATLDGPLKTAAPSAGVTTAPVVTT